ncbi:sensor histidine kinase [Paucibacter sp. XJ19-41]|uniref:sensor histidine kinase n=1 Tax=Paucibacter sp. XJ19-41 TaxID=2927824 RepID=UPI00234A534F|nr:ATP-binding protein [Paucibacter sp. XJ19-41]MDC6167452.1 ATP-binding protein [Paucibacter sp. XJ19-41]
MNSPWRRSLFKRLLCVQLGLIFLVQIGAISYELSRLRSGASFERDLRLLAEALGELVDASGGTEPTIARRLAERLQQISARYDELLPGELGWLIQTHDGLVLARSEHAPTLPVIKGDADTQWQGDWLLATHRSTCCIALAAYHRSLLQRTMPQTIGVTLAPLLLALLLLALVTWLATRFGLQPLRALAQRVGAAPELEALPPEVHAELVPLVQALNQRTERIVALLAAERAFFADAAHELRTPLAALLAQAHLLITALDDTSRKAALQALQTGIERAGNTLGHLLTLARVDASAAAGASLVPTDLVALGMEAVAQQAPRAVTCGGRLEWHCPLHKLCLRLDANAMRTLLNNLIDNSLRHAGPGCTVVVSLQLGDDGGAALSVIDDGVGIATHERKRVFERFARGSDALATGSGLGLAIVRRIAELHGGRVDCTPGPGGRGVEFRLLLPAALLAAAD